jgi:hypothetical protein
LGKKEGTKMFEFLLSYRNRKRKKQDSDSIIMKIQIDNDGKHSYYSFLQQFFNYFIDRIRRNWNEAIYKNLIKEARKSNMMLKKFLLHLQMFYFIGLKKENTSSEKIFTRKIDNFSITLRDLVTGRSKLCRQTQEKNDFNLMPVKS